MLILSHNQLLRGPISPKSLSYDWKENLLHILFLDACIELETTAVFFFFFSKDLSGIVLFITHPTFEIPYLYCPFVYSH